MSDSGTVRILGIAGPAARVLQRGALAAARDLALDGMTIEIFDLAPRPLYNDDVRREGYPRPVADFRARIQAADGLLIATPEHNYSTSWVLKNAIDWASRPPEHLFEGKPIGLMGASKPAPWDCARYHLRRCSCS